MSFFVPGFLRRTILILRYATMRVAKFVVKFVLRVYGTVEKSDWKVLIIDNYQQYFSTRGRHLVCRSSRRSEIYLSRYIFNLP